MLESESAHFVSTHFCQAEAVSSLPLPKCAHSRDLGEWTVVFGSGSVSVI